MILSSVFSEKLLNVSFRYFILSTKEPVQVATSPPCSLDPQHLSHTTNTRRHWGISAALSLLPSLIFFIFFQSSVHASSPLSPVQSLYSHASDTRLHRSQQDIRERLHLGLQVLCPACLLHFSHHCSYQPRHKAHLARPPCRKWFPLLHFFLVTRRWSQSTTILSSSLHQCFALALVTTDQVVSCCNGQWYCQWLFLIFKF